MSRRVLLANFVAMVVLSVVAAALVAFPPASPPAPEPLLPGLETSAVAALRLERRAGAEAVIRTPDGAWLCSWGGAPTLWPIADARIRGGLRLLAEATATPTAPGTDAPEPDSLLHIDSADGARTTLALTEASVAGRGAVAVRRPGAPERHALTDDRLHAVFSRTGLLPWRDDRAMPGVGRDPTRITVAGPTGSIELARTQSRWGLVAPIQERAEHATIQASIDALARTMIAEFRDDADPATLGLETPRVTITVAGGRGSDAYRWRLDIGAPATADGNRAFVRLTGHVAGPSGDAGRDLGPVHAVIPLDMLSAVYTSQEAYLARTSLATPAPDIRRFTIRDLDGDRAWTYIRTIDGWTVTPPVAAPTAPTSAGARPATAQEAAAIPAALEILASHSAAASRLAEPPGFIPMARLDVEGAGGLFAESVLIGRTPPPRSAPGAASVLATHAGVTWRTYADLPEALLMLLPTGP